MRLVVEAETEEELLDRTNRLTDRIKEFHHTRVSELFRLPSHISVKLEYS